MVTLFYTTVYLTATLTDRDGGKRGYDVKVHGYTDVIHNIMAIILLMPDRCGL